MGQPGRSSRRSSSSNMNRSSSSSLNRNNESKRSTAPVPASAPSQMATQSANNGGGGGGGFFSNVLQTATGVAIGHTMGHALTGLLGGGGGGSRSASETEGSNSNPATTQTASRHNQASSFNSAPYCEPHFKSFMECMERQNQDVQACQFYLDMLKHCQADWAPSNTGSGFGGSGSYESSYRSSL